VSEGLQRSPQRRPALRERDPVLIACGLSTLDGHAETLPVSPIGPDACVPAHASSHLTVC